MLLDDFVSVASANNREDLLNEAVKFTRRLGFNYVSVIAVLDHPGQATTFHSVDNLPLPAVELQQDDERGRRDPVMQHCKNSHLPIAWNVDTYRQSGKESMWEHQAQYGFRAGIAVAMHVPNGRHLAIGIDLDEDLPDDRRQVTRMAADLQLFTSCALDAAMRTLLPRDPQGDPIRLTERELEALRWTMEGKTAWELGCILGISEQTAARHIHNAAQKLGCVNKTQAVMKALRLKLIQ